MVSSAEALRVTGPARRFASRGGEKLEAALERFGVDPAGLDCLDAGASTGGFSDCLLRRGAARVAAVDVGYGQLAWAIRNDSRVTVLERTNVRDLRPGDLPFPPALVVADLAFISLGLVIPALAGVVDPGANFVLLVKPQFEAGPADVGRGGVVRDPAVWRRAIEVVAGACSAAGLSPLGVMASPLAGPAGNVEYLLHAGEGAAAEVLGIDAAIEEGRRIGGVA
jgi:23S rRNA (cytidine1920-2'-O)/16S rRNA (cytidine1409-2'-O)-methyltransferase